MGNLEDVEISTYVGSEGGSSPRGFQSCSHPNDHGGPGKIGDPTKCGESALYHVSEPLQGAEGVVSIHSDLCSYHAKITGVAQEHTKRSASRYDNEHVVSYIAETGCDDGRKISVGGFRLPKILSRDEIRKAIEQDAQKQATRLGVNLDKVYLTTIDGEDIVQWTKEGVIVPKNLPKPQGGYVTHYPIENTAVGDTFFKRIPGVGFRKEGTIVAIDHLKGKIVVWDGEEKKTEYDSETLLQEGHEAKGRKIYSTPHRIVRSGAIGVVGSGANTVEASGIAHSEPSPEKEKPLSHYEITQIERERWETVGRSTDGGITISKDYQAPDARRGFDPPSGPTRFGIESFESARSRGAYTGSRADFKLYSGIARSNMSDKK